MADDILRVTRAVVAWFVIVNLLFLIVAMLGGFGVSSNELLILLFVSVVLTVLALRAWDRSRARRGRATPNV